MLIANSLQVSANFSVTPRAALILFSISSVLMAEAPDASPNLSMLLVMSLVASFISVIPRVLATAIFSNRFIDFHCRPDASIDSLIMRTLWSSVANSSSVLFKRFPPKIAFNLPAACAAPSNVSNWPTMSKSL